ncbi:MAG: dTDP-4-dehydrorhamnose 3,5-epimerase [Terriglobia bacterium]
MEIDSAALPEVKIIKPQRYADRRGFFSETYNKRSLAEAGIHLDFVQDNHSFSVEKGVVRGIHFQVPPHAQYKLVQVIRGSVLDIALDLRRSSKTFGKHVSAVLSGADWNQMLIPIGFGHGFCTLEPNTEVVYKVTDYYAPECERGILWNDPEVGVAWPVAPGEAILSVKDMHSPCLAQSGDLFD